MAIFHLTRTGRGLAERLKGLYPHAQVMRFNPKPLSGLWQECGLLVFVMAAGIAVRSIAPYVKDKKTDPAVVVLDEQGRHAVSLLSGHVGGANRAAEAIAGFLGGQAVITTASEASGLTPLDVWAMDTGLVIEDWDLLPRISARFLERKTLKVYAEVDLALPEGFVKTDDPMKADVLITAREHVDGGQGKLRLRPRSLAVGVGCNRGTPATEIEDALTRVLKEHNLSLRSVACLATISLKGDEPGLRAFAEKANLKLLTFTPEELNAVEGLSRSEAALRATGAQGVSEPSALLAAGADGLLVPKQKLGNVTVAMAHMIPRGTIYVVGTGPGSPEHLTPQAREALRRSDVVVGYQTYLALLGDVLAGKEVVSTGMTREVDRCAEAIELAAAGKTVSVVSGGDPGIYAMAGLVFELLRKRTVHHSATIPVEVIPGVPALSACAARLGAPLMHDFAAVSLSDRLTPWKVIEGRLEAAARADFVIVIYNPRSKGRPEHIRRAREVLLRFKRPDTPVGIARGAMRADEQVVITDLARMLEHDIDMQTTVIVGNSGTFVWDGRMVTPRGYRV